MGEPTDLVHAETLAGPEPDAVRLVSPAEESDERYATEGELGKGGMGVISLCFDKRIGRRVARKQLRPELAHDTQIRARFLREAQVQGQLEHPAIVPVYDLTVRPDGTTAFTMKTVRGETLREIVEGLAAGKRELVARYSRHRLLTAFTSVCLAIDYAHQRGILHRDLKPANLMLGDYGEVYVLDWGLAKIRGASDEGVAQSADTPTPTAMTHVGSLLGTPGYMAPEQMTAAAEVTAAADVYALGAILFELLALEPLHPRASVIEAIESTRAGADARASRRAPDMEIPPELDAVCVRATALDPRARHGSARELCDEVQRFLEGQRDRELRREKSREHARAAAAASAEIRDGGGDSLGNLDARRRAMQEIGRALALDPQNHEAVGTMAELLASPPSTAPPEVRYATERSYRKNVRWISGMGAVVYAATIGFLPLLMWMGVRDPLVVGVFFGLLAACAGLSVAVWRAKAPHTPAILVAMALSSAAFAVAARFASPLLIAPTALAVNATGYAIFLDRRYRPLVAVTSMLGLLVPVLLEVTGVISPTLLFADGRLTVLPSAISLPRGPTIVMVTLALAFAIGLSALLVGRIRDELIEAQRRLMLYTWHLREFVPPEARPTTDVASGTAGPSRRRSQEGS